VEIISQLTINGLIAGALYTLMGVSFAFIYRMTKFFNIAHGIFIPAGAYATFVLNQILGLNLILSILVATLLCGFLGWALDKLIFYPLRKKGASGLEALLASLGVYLAMQSLTAIIFSSEYKTIPIAEKVYQFFGARISSVQLLIIVIAIASIASLKLLRNSKIGLLIRATEDNRKLALINKIKIERLTGFVFFVSASIAGLTGTLVGLDTGLEPTMGFNLMIKGIIAAIIGSFGLVGAGVGALILGLIESGATWFIGGLWKDATSYAFFIFYLVIKPKIKTI